MTEWRKNCPKCGKEIFYTNIWNFKRAEKHKVKCKSCATSGKNNPLYGKLLSLDHKRKIGLKSKGRKHTTETIEKIRLSHIGLNTWMKGKKDSEETRQKKSKSMRGIKRSESFKEKCRIKRLNEIELLGGKPNYNVNACKIIDLFGKQNGYHFRHALNGGEVSIAGYFLDGYDKQKNVTFEYDEPLHHTPSRKNKDIHKQKCIVDKIQPKMFIRYDEKNERLYDSLTNENIPFNPSIRKK